MFVSKLSFKQTASFSLKTTTTVIIHSTCYENHVSSPMMGIMIKLRIFDKIVTSASFPPTVKC